MGVVIALLPERMTLSHSFVLVLLSPLCFSLLSDALADMEAALRVDPNNQMALQALTRIKRSMKAMGM